MTGPTDTTPPCAQSGKIRADKWLWYARFFKTRSKAGEIAGSGGLRINGDRCSKASQTVRPGDVLTFPQARHVRVIRIETLGTRRGPASEASGLYTDLDPPVAPEKQSESVPPPAERPPGAGRPTKRARREIDALTRSRT